MKITKACTKLKAVMVITIGIVLLTGCTSSSPGDEDIISDDIIDIEDDIDEIDTDVIAEPVNTPDVQGGSDFYPNPVSSALLSGPLIGANSGSDRVFSRSIPFNQVEADRPIRVQRAVGTNFIEDGDEKFYMIFTVRNITQEVVCGESFNFSLHRADDSTGGLNSNADIKELWHGIPMQVLEVSSVITFDITLRSCIEPNSNIYISRSVLPSMALEDLARVNITYPRFRDLESDSVFTVTTELGNSVVIPTAYTVGSLPETDGRVRTGADDEFIKVTVVNNSPTVQNVQSAYMIMMDAEGFPVGRTLTVFEGFSINRVNAVEPGDEFELVYRNNVDVGDVSTVRVIVRASPYEPEEEG